MKNISLAAHFARRLGTLLFCGAMGWLPAVGMSTEAPQVDENGTIHVPSFAFPSSSFLSDEARVQLKDPHDYIAGEKTAYKTCPSIATANRADIAAIRKCLAEAFYRTAFYQRFQGQYDVGITSREIGGVDTEVFTPTGGVARGNEKRVLINLHGGAFDHGARYQARVESMPIAATGRIKVISVDYRVAPEYAFPAATEDVTAVYRELLKTYQPKNIGIYGCSAGGLLTAETIAWLQKHGLPLPGAIGMFCDGASYWEDGDSGHLSAALEGYAPGTSLQDPYFKGVDPNDPLAFPIRATPVMAKFPPSLLISSTRDLALSSVVQTHAVLVSQGVEAELHVWEGLGHAFFLINPDLPQSRQVTEVVVKFFDKYLGR